MSSVNVDTDVFGYGGTSGGTVGSANEARDIEHNVSDGRRGEVHIAPRRDRL